MTATAYLADRGVLSFLKECTAGLVVDGRLRANPYPVLAQRALERDLAERLAGDDDVDNVARMAITSDDGGVVYQQRCAAPCFATSPAFLPFVDLDRVAQVRDRMKDLMRSGSMDEKDHTLTSLSSVRVDAVVGAGGLGQVPLNRDVFVQGDRFETAVSMFAKSVLQDVVMMTLPRAPHTFLGIDVDNGVWVQADIQSNRNGFFRAVKRAAVAHDAIVLRLLVQVDPGGAVALGRIAFKFHFQQRAPGAPGAAPLKSFEPDPGSSGRYGVFVNRADAERYGKIQAAIVAAVEAAAAKAKAEADALASATPWWQDAWRRRDRSGATNANGPAADKAPLMFGKAGRDALRVGEYYEAVVGRALASMQQRDQADDAVAAMRQVQTVTGALTQAIVMMTRVVDAMDAIVSGAVVVDRDAMVGVVRRMFDEDALARIDALLEVPDVVAELAAVGPVLLAMLARHRRRLAMDAGAAASLRAVLDLLRLWRASIALRYLHLRPMPDDDADGEERNDDDEDSDDAQLVIDLDASVDRANKYRLYPPDITADVVRLRWAVDIELNRAYETAIADLTTGRFAARPFVVLSNVFLRYAFQAERRTPIWTRPAIVAVGGGPLHVAVDVDSDDVVFGRRSALRYVDFGRLRALRVAFGAVLTPPLTPSATWAFAAVGDTTKSGSVIDDPAVHTFAAVLHVVGARLDDATAAFADGVVAYVAGQARHHPSLVVQVGGRSWTPPGADGLAGALRAACPARDAVVVDGVLGDGRAFRVTIALVFVSTLTKRVTDCTSAAAATTFPAEGVLFSRDDAAVWMLLGGDDVVGVARNEYRAGVRVGGDPDRVVLCLAGLRALHDDDDPDEIRSYRGSVAQRLMAVANVVRAAAPTSKERAERDLRRVLRDESLRRALLIAAGPWLTARLDRLVDGAAAVDDAVGAIVALASVAFEVDLAGWPALRAMIDAANRQ